MMKQKLQQRIWGLLIGAGAALLAPWSGIAGDAFAQAPDRRESVQLDVSARRVAVTSSFTGTEVVVFGAVHNSRQTSAEAGYYDVVVIVEGTKEKLVARKKSRVAGIWINAAAQTFSQVPSYYAIASTRPLGEIASEATLDKHEIGFSHIHMRHEAGKGGKTPAPDLAEFRKSVSRIKQQKGLYISAPYDVAFVGPSLFRTKVSLPANVTVGPFATKVYLFRDGALLGEHSAKLTLEREGVERLMHAFAFGFPFWYGIFAVIVAAAAGLAASQIFSRGAH